MNKHWVKSQHDGLRYYS